MVLRRAAWIGVLSAFAATGCVRGMPRVAPLAQNADVASLWVDPADLARRDLFNGPGGAALAPDVSLPFTVVSEDHSGYSRGFDVKAADGKAWSVKLGPEAQTEVVSSRILWAIGYYQPPSYYVPSWQVTGVPPEHLGPARFRPDLPDWKVIDEWSWYENDVADTRAFKGLVVTNLILNNWDWKTSNNKVYEVLTPGGPGRILVVRDLGASLGRTAIPWPLRLLRTNAFKQGTRNDIDGFESQSLLTSVRGSALEFNYNGINRGIVKSLTRADVVWAATLLSRLSDAQWNDAFRAAGYDNGIRARYVAKIKAKIAEGLALADG
jgi:hypothetical protein